MTTLNIYRNGQTVPATADEVAGARQALGAAAEAHTHTGLMTQAQTDKLAGLPDAAALAGSLAGKASLVGGKLDPAQVPDIALQQYLGAVATEAAMLALVGQAGDWCSRSDTGTDWRIVGDPSTLAGWLQTSYPSAPVSSVNGKSGAVVLTPADIGSVRQEDLGPLALMTLPEAQAAVSGDRVRRIMRTDTPSADSVAGTNTVVPFGLIGVSAPVTTGFTKLTVVASKKPFTALQVGYIHVGGSGAAAVRMAVASTDDPGPLNYALGGADANLKKCISPRKSGVVYNTYSANGWQRVSFGGVMSDATAATVADTGSTASCNILMSDVIPCASVAAADGLHYALIRVDDGAAPSTRAGIGYTGFVTGTQYQDDAGFARVFGCYRGVAGVTDPSLWPEAYTASFSDTAQCPLVVRFVQGSIDGDMPVTGMMCGDSRFDATGGTDATAQYRGTAFLLAQSLNAAGRNHHMIRACGGGYTSATYYDRGSKLLAVASPAWAMYTVYTVNDGVPTQAIIDAAKLRAQQFVRLCAAKNIRVGLVTAYPRTGMAAPAMALLTALDAWAAATGLPYYSPLAEYGTAAGEWRPGTNIDSNHMTAAQYRVYAADLQAWLLTWSGI